MATGFAIALLWPEIYKDIQKEFEIEMEMYNLVVAFSAALAVNVVVSLLTPKRISALT